MKSFILLASLLISSTSFADIFVKGMGHYSVQIIASDLPQAEKDELLKKNQEAQEKGFLEAYQQAQSKCDSKIDVVDSVNVKSDSTSKTINNMIFVSAVCIPNN